MHKNIDSGLAAATILAGGANGLCALLWPPALVGFIFPHFWFDGNFSFFWLGAPLGAIVGVVQGRYVVTNDIPSGARRVVRSAMVFVPLTIAVLVAANFYANYATAR